MIKAIIFDIGNVLLPFDFAIAIRKLRQKSEVDSLLAAMEPVKFAYESGAIGRGEFVERMRTVLHYTGSEEEFVSVWEDIFWENPPMLEAVQALQRQYPLYLLSNTSDLHIEYVFAKHPALFGLFKDGVYSYRAKCFKPDRKIFEMALKQFGVVAGETLFVDDLQPNVDAALALGMNAVRYDYKRHGDFVGKLKERGIEL
jgi:putative hydrolase of the HAD superfamily